MLVGCVLLGAVSLLAGCLYDSRWGQAKQSQRSVAQHMTPQGLRPTAAKQGESDGGRPNARPSDQRVLRLRAHATTKYMATTVEWQRRLAQTIDVANRVLGPTLGARLEVAEVVSWAPAASEDDLGALLKELHGVDPGGDVEWVVGFAAAVPRFELSFHQLGMGDVIGKYFVVRAMSNAAEYQAIRSEFSELGDDERTKLYESRLQHKAATVLLHELGHTLAALHESEPSSVMHRRYSPKATMFSEETAEVMRIALEHRGGVDGMPPSEAFARALLERLQRQQGTWLAGERDELVARLQRQLEARSDPADAGAPPTAARTLGRTDISAAPVKNGGLEALTDADRGQFEQAVQEQKAGRPREAWTKAEPLFGRYPKIEAVQDLRCQLALQQGLLWQEVRAQCDALMQLTPGLDKKRTK